jgi:hypothetical protein
MKQVSKIVLFVLSVLLLTQPVAMVSAKEESNKPDPKFKDKAEYVDTTLLPYYGKDAVVDVYSADGIYYAVDEITEDIVTIEPEEMVYQIEETYSEEELKEQAISIITDFLGEKVKLDKLTYSLGQKTGTFFFRWEDIDKKNDDGNYAFIQIGLSQNGDFLNLVNTIPFGKKYATQSSKSLFSVRLNNNLIGPFTQVYANGGSFWTTNWTWNSTNSATGGYFYLNSGCSGTFCSKFYYASAASSGTIYGRWTPNTNTSTRASVFIPSTNATATVQYEISKRSGAGTILTIVDQNAYYNAWKLITPSTISQGISYVRLWNIGFNGTGSSAYKVAWDEVWVYNP